MDWLSSHGSYSAIPLSYMYMDGLMHIVVTFMKNNILIFNTSKDHIYLQQMFYKIQDSGLTVIKKFSYNFCTRPPKSTNQITLDINWSRCFNWSFFSSMGTKLLIESFMTGEDKVNEEGLVLVWFMELNTTFNNIWIILLQSVLLVEETGVPGENHWPVVSHRGSFMINDDP